MVYKNNHIIVFANMSQLQVYSNKFSFYYSLGYFVIVPVKIAIVGVIIFYIFQQIQKKVKNFIDKFNLLENNLREINKKYDILLSELIVSKEEYKNLSNNHQLWTLDLFSSLENKLIQMNETNNKNNELIEFKFAESSAITESELYKLNSQINNDYVLIGYNFVGNNREFASPVFESVNAFASVSEFTKNWASMMAYDCFIVSQLKYFKNIKEINIMNVIDKIFLFNDLDISELCYRKEKRMLTCFDACIQKNKNLDYFVAFRYFFQSNGTRLNLFNNQPYEYTMYVKNGVKKLYNELKKININLTMPDEVSDFVFN